MNHYKTFTFFTFLFFTITVYGQDPQKNNAERKAIKMVNTLREVIKAKKYFKMTRYPLHDYIDGEDKDTYYIRVARFVGDSVIMTQTQFVFLFKKKGDKIKYWDIPDDTVVSIAGWRKNNYAIEHPARKRKVKAKSK